MFSSTDHLGGTEMAVPWSFNQFTPQTRMFGGGTWPAPGSRLWHGGDWTGKGASDLDLLALSFEGLLYSVCLVSGISMRYKHTMSPTWALIHSRKWCVDCAKDLKVATDHVSSQEHLANADNARHDTFNKCHKKDQFGDACRNLNSCKHCRDAVAKGWANYVASSIVAFIACVRDCESWGELQARQRSAIEKFVTSIPESDIHLQRIASTQWWKAVPANGEYAPVLWLMLLKLDVRLLGDVGVIPGMKFAHYPQTKDDNDGHNMSYMWQENLTAASGITAIIVPWRMAFGNTLRVPLHSSIPEDIYDTLGGRRLVTWICRAKAPIMMGEGPPCGDILAAVHDRSMVVGAAGAARLAIGAPPPPTPLFAIMAPPHLQPLPR